jgi:hypothetical protein
MIKFSYSYKVCSGITTCNQKTVELLNSLELLSDATLIHVNIIIRVIDLILMSNYA